MPSVLYSTSSFADGRQMRKKLCVAAAGRAGIFSSFNHRLAAQLIINANRETLMQIYSCRYNPLHFITVYQVFTIQFVDNKTKITTLL